MSSSPEVIAQKRPTLLTSSIDDHCRLLNGVMIKAECVCEQKYTQVNTQHNNNYYGLVQVLVYMCMHTCTIDAWAFKGTATGIFHVPQ